MHYRKTIITTLFITCAAFALRSQTFNWKTGYYGFFDNREYFNDYVNDQTIFGTRISGELGYSFNENNRVMTGADYLYEFGSKGEWIAPDFIAYYNGKRGKLDFYLGAFPRINRVRMPLALMNDTFQYYRPIQEGIFLEFKTRAFRHNLWIDWISRQSYKKRETFLLGFSGYAQSGIFTWQHHLVMTHLAHSLNTGTDERIRDNAGFSAMPGIDLSGLTGLDSLCLSVGFLGSVDRIRGNYDFRVPFGFLGELEAVYKGFGLHGTLYAGESQVILPGDGFYKATFYSRADAFYALSTPHIQGRLQFSLHFIPGVVDLSMSLTVRAQLEGIIRGHQSNSLK